MIFYDILFDYTSINDKLQSTKDGYSLKELLKENKFHRLRFTYFRDDDTISRRRLHDIRGMSVCNDRSEA